MSEDTNDRVSRRGVLRKVGSTAIAGIAGVAAISGNAAAFSPGTRVQIHHHTEYVVERKECCGGCAWGCCGGYRNPGDKGTVLGKCDYPNNMELYFIDWDEEDTSGGEMDASAMEKQYLHQISP